MEKGIESMVDNQIDFSLAKVILFSFETDLTKEQYCHCNYNNNFHLKCTGPTVMSFGKKSFGGVYYIYIYSTMFLFTPIKTCAKYKSMSHAEISVVKRYDRSTNSVRLS